MIAIQEVLSAKSTQSLRNNKNRKGAYKTMAILVEHLLALGREIPSKEAVVFLISVLPVLELRGGILAASYLGISLIRAILLCVAGCFFPVPFILLLIRCVLQQMKRFQLTRRIAQKIEHHGQTKGEQIGKYEFWGLFLFVAVPLPGTGAWTGALVASLLQIRFGRAMLAIFLGVLVSAALMTGLSYGILDLVWGS